MASERTKKHIPSEFIFISTTLHNSYPRKNYLRSIHLVFVHPPFPKSHPRETTGTNKRNPLLRMIPLLLHPLHLKVIRRRQPPRRRQRRRQRRPERRPDVADQRPQHGDALHDDGAGDFRRVPDGRHAEAPEVQFVFGVALVFPVGSDGCADGDDHALS